MKKILFLLLCTVVSYGQTYQNPTFGTVKTKTAPTVTTTPHLGTVETDGTISKITPENLPVSTATTNALELETNVSAGAVSGFALTNNGNGTVNISSGIAYLRATNDPYAPIIKYPIAAVTNLTLTDNANNYVLVDYNAGSPTLTVTTNASTINIQTNSLAYVIARVGNDLEYLSLVGQNVDPNAKLRDRFLNQEGIRRLNGAVLGFSNRNLNLTAGVLASGLIKINTIAFNTASPDTFTLVYNNGSTWTRTSGQTQVDNTQYNVSGTLTTMPNNTFRTDYVYLLPNNPSKLYVVLGTTTYGSLTLAKAAPRPSSLPVELQVLGVEVGRLFIEKNSATIAEVQSSFANEFTGAAVPEHNALTGLQGGEAGYYGHTSNVATSTAFTNYYGDVANSGIPQPKTLANTRTEIVTTTAVDAAKPNIVTGTGTTNTIMKWGSSSTGINSNLSDSGTLVTSSTDMSINGIRAGRGAGNSIENTVFGNGAVNANTTGSFITAFGRNALQSNTIGTNNFAGGRSSLAAITTQSSNTAVGNSSASNLQGANNLLAGYEVFVNATSGNNNTILGYRAARLKGDKTTNLLSSSNSIIIGQNASPLDDSQTNQIVIGDNAIGLGSNTSVIGNSSTTFGRWWGNFLVGTSTNNGNAGRFAGTVDVNKLQLNNTLATATGTPPILTWNSTTKDVESVPYATFAPTASPAFTGTPTAPTATAGTNTTQVATTAFVQTANADNLKTTGDQSFTGIKSVTNSGSGGTQVNGITMINNGTNLNSDVLNITNTSLGKGIKIINTGTGAGVRLEHSGSASGFQLANSSTGDGLFLSNTSSGQGLRIDNASTGRGLRINNQSSGPAIEITNSPSQSGIGIIVNSTGTGNLYTGRNNAVDTYTVDKFGVVTSTQYRISALNTAPASATDTGTTGEIRITATYIYICTATNTWVRTALTTW